MIEELADLALSEEFVETLAAKKPEDSVFDPGGLHPGKQLCS